jgi:hypothetical protein
VGWVFGTTAATLAVLLVWGLVSPRTQWRVLRSWSVDDAQRYEPGGTAVGLLRLASGIGLVGLAAVGIVGASTIVAGLPKPPPPVDAIEEMWGAPPPLLLNRVFFSAQEAPGDLLGVPLLGYQSFDDGVPRYLLDVPHFTRLGVADVPGLIGREPDEGTSAIGQSNILVHVRGPILCVPRVVVLAETETTVQLGVFYGLPDTTDDAPIDHLGGCRADDPLTGSLLIPVQLSGPVLDREVIGLDGVAVPDVEDSTE